MSQATTTNGKAKVESVTKKTQEERIESWFEDLGYDPSVGDTTTFDELDNGTMVVVVNLASAGVRRKRFVA